MNKLYLSFLFVGLLSYSASSQVMWDNFEDVRKGTYGFINGVFIPYSENTQPNDVNSSLVAASYTRNQAEEFDVLILEGDIADMTDYVNGSRQMSIDVLSPAVGTTVQITVENSDLSEGQPFPQGRHSIFLAETTTSGEWETLTFEFDTQPDDGVGNTETNRLVLLFDPGSFSNDTYRWDNLMGPEFADDPCEGVTPNPEVLNDFECNQNVNFIFSHSGVGFKRILNPDDSGNASPYVAEYTRNAGEESDIIIGRFDGPLLITENTTIELDVWDPAAPTSVIVSLQAANGDVIIEMETETSVSGQWETLTYDPTPAAASTDIEQFVILFDPGNFSSDTYYFDNFTASNLVGLNEFEPFAELRTYPNPTSEDVNFSYNLENTSDVQLAIQDVTGKVVELENYPQQSAGSQLLNIDVTKLNPGIYLYSLTSNSHRSTGKIVVSR